MREIQIVFARERETQSECVVRNRVIKPVCVCVCVREREREKARDSANK